MELSIKSLVQAYEKHLRSAVAAGKSQRGRITGFAMALILLSGLAAIVPPSALASPSDSSHSGGFWLVITSDETFPQAVNQAYQSAGSQVTSTLRKMLLRVEAGNSAYIPEGTSGGVASVRASKADLTRALAAATQGSTEAGNSRVDALAAADPSGFPVIGNACNDNFSWCNLQFEAQGEYCTDSCDVVDRVTANLTDDPAGGGTSRINYVSQYPIDSGDFTGVHFEWWTLKFASQTECGTGNTNSWTPPKSGSFNATCDVTLYNSRITHAFTFFAYFAPNAQYISANAKSGTAVCQPGPESSCLY
jgi:hypothetical protein